MKHFSILLLLLAACGPPSQDNKELQAQVDSLKHRLDEAYKPGLGEFMSMMQAHHQKLWFAGKAGNWELASFEVDEIKETIDDIRAFAANRKEIKEIGIIDPAVDSISNAVEKKDARLFERSFLSLTNTCNTCHQKTDFGFNKIKVPESSSYPNQDFDAK